MNPFYDRENNPPEEVSTGFYEIFALKLLYLN